MPRLLIVEDNRLIREAVTEGFQVAGYDVVAVDRFSAAVDALERSGSTVDQRFDALILDIRLPDGNGYALAKRVRAQSDVPIVFLTAKDSESERVMGFETGADDYVVKPFSTKELVLRVGAILRRAGAGTDARSAVRYRLGDVVMTLDIDARRVDIDGAEVALTPSEWRILVELAGRPGQAVTREWILSECLDHPYAGAERTVDTHIANLRAHLGDDQWIETVRGYGYRFARATPLSE
ncbi:MAG: DNA-binding response regulator [Spirochaetaceae bacterium]|nr:MAG: DNA-binding response regulator [Spirochaetaceae bacterium]